jgi:hypothetical protein
MCSYIDEAVCVMHVMRIFNCRSRPYYRSSHSGGLKFKSRTRDRECGLKFSWLCSFLPGRIAGIVNEIPRSPPSTSFPNHFFANYPITIRYIWPNEVGVSRGGDSEICFLAKVTPHNLIKLCRRYRKFCCLPNQDRWSVRCYQTIRDLQRCVVRAK